MPRCAPRRSGRTSAPRDHPRADARSCRSPCVPGRSSRAALQILQSDAHDLPAALLQRAVVALGLSADQAPEPKVPARNRNLVAGVVDHLDEQTCRRASLVKLSRGVQVAWPEPVRDDTPGRARPFDQRLQLSLAHWIDERLNGDVIRRLSLAEQLVERALACERGILARGEHLLRLVLGRLDVGLVERVDPQNRAGDRDGELPAEELGADRGWVVEPHLRPLPIGAVGNLPGRGHEPFSVLAGRLRDQLLGPETESPLYLGDADLVAPLAPRLAELESELDTWVLLRTARLRHPLCVNKQLFHVDAHQGGGDDAERRHRRIPPADRRLAREHRRPVLARLALEGRARIADGHEALWSLNLDPEVREVGERLERRSRLRRDDEHRLLEVEQLLRVTDHRGVCRVENVEALPAEGALQDLRGQRGAAHPEQDERLVRRARLLRERNDLADPFLHALRLVEPAQPFVLVRAGPDRRVPRPDALDQLLLRGDAHFKQRPARRAWP